MAFKIQYKPLSSYFLALIPVALLLLPALSAPLHAQQSEEFDNYKVRLDAFWFYSKPTGTIQANGDTVPVDLNRDLGFESYPTFTGAIDWKVTHKNHLYLVISPFFTTKQTTLSRTITFEGQTFELGATVKSDLHAFFVAPGYQYDFIRRKRGHLGVAAQIDLFKTTAKISALAQVSGGGSTSVAYSASGALLAPIPVAGPEFRLYLTNSPRLFIEGNLLGMYFFGYGSFVSTADFIGITLTKHISVNAGYQLASHLTVNGTSDRLGLQLSQKGAIAGAQFSF